MKAPQVSLEVEGKALWYVTGNFLSMYTVVIHFVWPLFSPSSVQSYTVIYALGIRISCCYICTHSMCVFNHAYITCNTPLLHQNTQRYLLLCPHTLLRPSILDLSNYLTCYPLFQKNSPLFYSVTAEENRKLDISYQIFWFSLFWTGFISYSRLLPLVRKKVLHGFAQNLRK